jgi:hypothetical protein
MKRTAATLIGMTLLLASPGSREWVTAMEPSSKQAQAAELGLPANPAHLKPFIAFAWLPTARLDHVSAMLINDGDPVKMAFSTKTMADGCKVVLGLSLPDGLVGQPDDRCVDALGKPLDSPGIWPEHGIALVSRRCQRMFSAFAFARGKCDLLVLDYEQGWSHWTLSREQLAAIEHDPRFPAVRERLGFDGLSERASDWRAHPDDAARWESVQAGLFSDAVNRAVGIPLWANLPGAGLSNYGSAVISKANALPDLNGHAYYCEGKPVGTCQSPPLYGLVGAIGITGFPGDWSSPMTALVLSADTVRASVRSSGIPIIPWVAYRSYPGDGPGQARVTWVNTGYWQENVYHAMLSSAGNDILFWNPHPPRETKPVGAAQRGATAEDEQAMEDALAGLDAQARGSPLAAPLFTENVDYRATVLVSASRTQAGRLVARVTFAPGADSADVKIGETPYHVTRPDGKVGAWVDVP